MAKSGKKETGKSKTKPVDPETKSKKIADTKPAKNTGVLSDSKLAAVDAPKNLGAACIALDVKELRAKVSAMVDILAFNKVSEDVSGGTENAILVNFKDPEKPVLQYVKSGASVTVAIGAKVFKPGSFVVDVALFRAVRGNSPFIVLIKNKEQNSVEFKCGGTRGAVQMLATASEYLMNAPTVEFKANIVLPKPLITEVFGRLMFNSFDPGLPAVGLPLNISVKSGKITVTSNDNIVGAVYTKTDKILPEFNVCVPGQALIRAVKHLDSSVVKFGYSDSAFRIKSAGYDVIHPIVTYDVVDLKKWIEEETERKPEYELVLPTLEFIEAIENAMAMAVMDKTESKITIEFSEDKGKVIFAGSNTQALTNFKINKTIKSGKSMSIVTNGKRIVGFVGILKVYPEFRLRVSKGRAFLYAPDDSFIFLVPLA
jgi:DNA polymerase III sliding clamp (beta) subunit (PCNA family)